MRINPKRRCQDHPPAPVPRRGRCALRRRRRTALRYQPQPRRARRCRRAAPGRHLRAPDRIRALLAGELARGQRDERFPLAPARIVADTRAALGREDIVLVDTGALKMWMARLYPTYEPNTCLISNGLSTMAWTVPGAIGAKIARPDCRVLVATGDGAFLMNSQEIETALRLGVPFVILIWVDDAYGLISWKMDLEIGRNVDTTFANPDFVAYAESFGATGVPDRVSRRTAPGAAHRTGRRHRVGDRLPRRLRRQPRAHRVPRRPGRAAVMRYRRCRRPARRACGRRRSPRVPGRRPGRSGGRPS